MPVIDEEESALPMSDNQAEQHSSEQLLQQIQSWWHKRLQLVLLPAVLNRGWTWPDMQWDMPQRLCARADAHLQQKLQSLPLPRLACTRRSALRFHVDYFEWDALLALHSAHQHVPLELVLEG